MLMNLGGPILANLGFSGCMGAVAGMALKVGGMGEEESSNANRW